MILWRHMVCECEYALCHSHQNLCCSLQWTLDQVEIHPNLTAHCPSGTFPASRYISTCILLYLYNDTWTHYVVVLKRTVSLRQIIWAKKTPLKWYTAARRFSNDIFMIYIYSEIISTVILLPSAESFMKGCCQLQAKVCARLLVNCLFKLAQEKVLLGELTVPQWP